MKRTGLVGLVILGLLVLGALVQPGPDEGVWAQDAWLQSASYSVVARPAPASSYEVTVPLAFRNYALLPDTAWSSTAFVQNTGGVSVTLTIDARDLAGSEVDSIADALAPWGSRGYDLASMASLGDSFAGTLVITSDRPLAVAAYVRESAWLGDGLASFTPRCVGSTVLYAQQVYNDFFGWTSRLAVANVGDSEAALEIEFYSFSGDRLATHNDTLAPRTGNIYDPASIQGLPGGSAGTSMAVIRASQPLVGAVMHLNASSANASASSLRHEPGSSIYLPSLARFYSDYSATSGHVLWNVGTDMASVTIAYYDTAGHGLVADASSIWPGQQRLTYLGAIFSLPDGFIGSAVVTSSEPLVGEASTVLSAPGASMMYSAVSETASTLYAPFLRRSAWAYTTLTVQNATSASASVTVSYYDDGGTLAATQSDTLPAYTSHVYDQGHMSALGEDFSGSAVIRADRALAAVVQEYRQVETDSLTPTPTATSTPSGTPTVEPGAERVFLPVVAKTWPPVPARPVLNDISIDCNDNDYLVSWATADRAVSYTLQEDDNPAFPGPTTVYQGANTSRYLYGKVEGTYYYRVKATNRWGDSPWSETKSVTVGPPMTLWTIENDTGGDLTIDIHGVAKRSFPPGEHTWCVPSGEHTFTVRARCGSLTDTYEFEPYGTAWHRFWCASAQSIIMSMIRGGHSD